MDKVTLEGAALRMYLYVAKTGKPVGAHDIMRGAEVRSSGLTYKQLQRLENLGLIAKNDYGNYVLQRKLSVKGYVWVGGRLLPRMTVYSFGFLGILIVELLVLAIHFEVETYEFKVFFLLLGLVTVAAMAGFLVEGFRVQRKMQKKGIVGQ